MIELCILSSWKQQARECNRMLFSILHAKEKAKASHHLHKPLFQLSNIRRRAQNESMNAITGLQLLIRLCCVECELSKVVTTSFFSGACPGGPI